MKRVIFTLVGTVAGLVALLSYKTEGQVATAASGLPSAGLPASTTSAPATDAPTGATRHRAPSSSAPTTSASYTGTAVRTRYGIVQVKVAVSGSKITNVSFVQLDRVRRPLAADQLRRRADPVARDPQRPEREDRHRFRRDLHQRRLRAVVAERARSGRHPVNSPTDIRLAQRHVEPCMGTVFSIDVRSPGVGPTVIEDVDALAALGRPHLLHLPSRQRDKSPGPRRAGTG